MGGNKRQRLARKKFRVVTRGDESKPQADAKNAVVGASEDGSHQVKKKPPAKKRKVAEVSEVNDAAHVGSESEEKGAAVLVASIKGESKLPSQNGAEKPHEKSAGSNKPGRKHPLRIPGMKPGEGCFICKGTDHIAKLCPTKSSRDQKKICLLCRTVGHTLKNCPTRFESQVKFCYNCGENGHRLAECKKPLQDGGTTFAECFICKEKGHLSRSCPTNPHGIYPKGGCCKLCQGVTHLAKDCPTKKAGGHLKLKISTATAPAPESYGGGKRTVFKSGDDLGDDFVSDNEEGGITGALSYSSDGEAPENGLKATGLSNSITKVKKTKGGKGLTQVTPTSIGSRKMHHTPKVVKFQRSQ